ncbi:MAG: hypothetical protein U5K76_02460 [Woeseiaceae bacterium]|nr:hypothetical protein [Woeseiaceae bacterium]
MFPDVVVQFFAARQELLWLTTLAADLACTVLLYRLFGKAGLQVAIATAIILANLQGPKLDGNIRAGRPASASSSIRAFSSPPMC